MHTIGQQPGSGKIMLHHRHITIGRILGDVGLATLYILELDLLVFLGLGIHRRAREGGIERRLSGRLVAIPYQLQVKLRRNRCGARVHDLVLDGDIVGTTLDGPGLDQFHATLVRGLEAHADLVLTILEFAGPGHHGHHRLVRGEGATDQPRLCHIYALRTLVEQQEVARLVGHVSMLEQLRMDQRTAFAVEGQAVQIGLHLDALTRHRGCRHRLARHGSGALGHGTNGRA
ncbi:hypothetical protein D3C71_1473780 [compost metagenome]